MNEEQKRKYADENRGYAYLVYPTKLNDIFHINNYEINNEIEVKKQEDLDLVILVIYDYLKKGIRHFDNGYGNFGTNMPISNLAILDQKLQEMIKTKMPSMDKRFKEYFIHMEREEQLSFEYLLFELSYIIRHYDGNNLYNRVSDDDDELDYNMDDNIDYPKIQVMKHIYNKEIPNINFLSGVLNIVLPKETQCMNHWVVINIRNLYITDFYEFIYLLLSEVVVVNS